MEHRQGVQQDIAIIDARVPAERHRIEGAIAVRQLDAFRPRGRPRGVVDRARDVLVRLPPFRLTARRQPGKEPLVRLAVEDNAPANGETAKGVVELRVDEDKLGAGMPDDEGDLGHIQPEIDRHEDAAGAAHPEEGDEHPGGVRADNGDPPPDRDPELVESRRHPVRAGGELAIGERAESARHVGFVHDGDAVGKDEGAPVEKVGDGEGNLHLSRLRSDNAVTLERGRSA